MPVESSPPDIIEILGSTLERIEQSGEINPGDPAFVKLKRSVARAIAEFEVAKTARSEAEVEPPLLESNPAGSLSS
jgi:hypothetical protein